MKDASSIKIFVSAHKPSDFVNDDIFAPIQVGAALSGHKKIAGILHDNEGKNISDRNPRYCELTAQYWAWQNAEPADYFGFFHYRRYFAFDRKKHNENAWGTIEELTLSEETITKYQLTSKAIKKVIRDYDIVLPEIKDITRMPKNGVSVREQYTASGFLYEKDLNIMLDVLREQCPEYLPYAEKYLNGKMSYLNNMFIMRRELFKNYSKWLFSILAECDKRIDYTDYSVEAIRSLGHLAERLLNIYLMYLRDHGSYKVLELPTLVILKTDPFPVPKPAFQDNNIAIALSANDFYAPYVATVLNSIKCNALATNNYDILIMNKDFTDNSKRRLQKIFAGQKNFSLRFVDISRFESRFSKLFLRGHFTIETWFRLLMPEIMPNYDKILYIDSDLVVNADIAELYNTDVRDYLLAACHDADTAGLYNGFEPKKKDYMDKILKIKKPYEYFQAGVILFNLAKFREQFSTTEMLRFAGSYNWQLLDQDVLNYLAQGKVKFVDMAWNVMYDWRYMRRREIIARAPKYLSDEYDRAHVAPKILHYAGPDKPWMDPSVDYGELFWQYARGSYFYEDCIARLAKVGGVGVRQRMRNFATKRLLPVETGRGRFVRKIMAKVKK